MSILSHYIPIQIKSGQVDITRFQWYQFPINSIISHYYIPLIPIPNRFKRYVLLPSLGPRLATVDDTGIPVLPDMAAWKFPYSNGRASLSIYLSLCLCIYECIYTVRLSIYIYIHTHTHYIYIYIHMWLVLPILNMSYRSINLHIIS